MRLEVSFDGFEKRLPARHEILTQAAVVAWVFACWTGAIKMDLTNATHVVFRNIPPPRSNRVPLLYGDLHTGCVVTVLFLDYT